MKIEITNNKSKPLDASGKTHALAAKQRLAEAKKKMMALQEEKKTQNFVEITEMTKKLNNSTIINTIDNNKQELKSKASLQESLAPSIQNKENILPDDSSIKRNSKSRTSKYHTYQLIKFKGFNL